MKKIQIIAYIVVFIFIFNCIGQTLSFKYGDGIISLEYMYEQNDIDVLVLGSSHAFEDINTATLYDEFGIAAYIAGGSVQPYWNSYYYLCETLENQNPKLVVLEAYASTFTAAYSDHSRIIKNSLGIKDYSTRLETIKVSARPEEVDNYVLSYRLWHSRYEELSKTDFSIFYNTPKYKYYKGYGLNFNTNIVEQPMVDDVSGLSPMFYKTEEYYLKIIDLCKEKNIPLMIVVSPYILTEKEQEIYNYSSELASEHNIPFINFNSTYYYEKMGLDFEIDFADPSHLNYLGGQKYSKVLGEEILNLFSLDDQRNNTNYDSYKLHSKDINRRISNYELLNETSITEFINSVSAENDYYVVISFVTNTYDAELKAVLSSFQQLSSSIDLIKDSNCVIIDNDLLDIQTELIYNKMISIDQNTIQCTSAFLNTDDNLDVVQSLSYNGHEYIDDQQGCYIMVYDKFEKNLVTVKQIKYEDNELVLITK